MSAGRSHCRLCGRQIASRDAICDNPRHVVIPRSLAAEKMAPADRRASCTERMMAAYLAETDREFAEAFWGSQLRERGAL